MSKSVVDKGPWHHGVTQDGKRHFVQSEDFRHDTRLYIDGDFAGTNDKERYAKGIATQLNAAPVATQPDVTQQTLDDVMAGIPARDAEIEALRKEIEALQAQLVDRSPEMQGTLVDESPKLQSQKQPVSGADGLPTERVLIDGTAYELPAAVAAELLRLHLEILGAEQERAALAQQDADKVDAEPDMFWNADNPEQCQSSIHNLLVEIQCDRSLHVGNIVEVQRAMSLPNISVRITTVDDDGDLEFKIINEADIDAARMESSQ